MAKIEIPQHISAEEFQLLQKASVDVFYFASLAWVRHPVRGRVKFELYPYQIRVLWYFLTKRFNIVLKFRQAGLTELIALFVLWLALFHPNKNIVIISIKDRVAKRVLGRIRYIYKNLPRVLQTPIINGRTGEFGTATEMEFSNGSLITSVPTTEDAGRSEATSLLVIDEAAIVRWANQIWASAFPSLSTGGAAILNSCVTGDTEVIGEKGNFRIDAICPQNFGKIDISHLGLKVLSHTGNWRKVLASVNKGQLETWEVLSDDGDSLKCTPNHKLYTSDGWLPVKEIVERGKYVITYDTGVEKLKPPPITILPKVEILRPIPGFPNYKVSNLGKVFINKNGNLIEKGGSINNRGYRSIPLWDKGIKKKYALSHLVCQAFIGDLPEGYIVDHINCNPLDDYSTNLQIITISENGQRAAKYSRGMAIGGKIGKGFANLTLIAKIREDELRGEPRYQIADKYSVPRSYITRTLDNTRVRGVQISKLTLIRKYIDTIYDICVEGDESYITNSKFINHNTPFGVGNWFHSTWVDAIAGGNNFNAIRLKWDMHPERDLGWYNSMRQVLGPKRTAQEIDGDFLSSGDSVFDLVDIRDIEESLTAYSPERKLNGNLLIFERPKRGQHYFLGADVASGRSRDYSAFSIMDRNGDEKVCFKGKIPPDRFADLIMGYGHDYNNALLAPEGNDIGLATVLKCQEDGYPNLYYTTQVLKEKGESRPKVDKFPGWLTTTKNRPLIIDKLEEDIRNNDCNIKNPFFVNEAYTFIYDERNKPIAMGKEKRRGTQEDDAMEDSPYTDDAILAESITNYIRGGRFSAVVVAPQ